MQLKCRLLIDLFLYSTIDLYKNNFSGKPSCSVTKTILMKFITLTFVFKRYNIRYKPSYSVIKLELYCHEVTQVLGTCSLEEQSSPQFNLQHLSMNPTMSFNYCTEHA